MKFTLYEYKANTDLMLLNHKKIFLLL